MAFLDDILNNNATAQQNFSNGGGSFSILDTLEKEKKDRIAAKESKFGVDNPSIFENINDVGFSDGDSARGKNPEAFRMSPGGLSYDAWDKPRSPEFYDPKWNNQGQEAADQKVKQLMGQLSALDKLRNLPQGTSTLKDLEEQAYAAEDMANTLLDKARLENPNAKVEFRPTTDKKTGRVISDMLIDGKSILQPMADNPEFNSKYNTQYYQSAKKEQEQKSQYAYDGNAAVSDRELGTTKGYLKDSFLRAISGVQELGTDAIQGAIGATNRAIEDATGITNKDRDMQAQVKELEQAASFKGEKPKYTPDMVKFLEGKDYNNEQYDFEKGVADRKKKITRAENDKTFLGKIANGYGDVKDASFKALATTVDAVADPLNIRKATSAYAKSVKNTDEGFNASKVLDKTDEVRKFQDAIDEGAKDRLQGKINNKLVREKTRQDEMTSGRTLNVATKQLKEGIDSGDTGKIVSSIGSYLKAGYQVGKSAIDNKGAGGQTIASSLAPMVAMAAEGTVGAVVGSSVFGNIVDSADRNFRKNNNGQAAGLADRGAIIAGSAAIVAIQKGGADIAFKNIKLKALGKTGKEGKVSTYTDLVDQTTNKINLIKKEKPANAPSLIKDVLAKTDDVFRNKINYPAFSKNPTLNKVAKYTGKGIGEVAKSLFHASVVIGKKGAEVAKAGAGEYGEEFSEDVLGQIVNNLGTGKDIDFMQAHLAGSMGFGAGAGTRAAIVAPNTAVSAVKAGLRISGKAGNTDGSNTTDNTDTADRVNVKAVDAISSLGQVKPIKSKDENGKATVREALDIDKIMKSPEIAGVVTNPHKEPEAIVPATKVLMSSFEQVLGELETAEKGSEKEAELGRIAEELHTQISTLHEAINNPKSSSEKTASKKVEEYSDEDVVNSILNPEEGYSKKVLKDVQEHIKSGSNKYSKNILKKVDKVNKLAKKAGDGVVLTANEVQVAGFTKNKEKGKSKKTKSLNEYMVGIQKTIEEGNVKEAKKYTRQLSSWARTQNRKVKAMEKIADKGGTLVWGGKTYTQQGAKTLLPTITQEAALLDLHSEVAKKSYDNMQSLAKSKRSINKKELNNIVGDRNKLKEKLKNGLSKSGVGDTATGKSGSVGVGTNTDSGVSTTESTENTKTEVSNSPFASGKSISAKDAANLANKEVATTEASPTVDTENNTETANTVTQVAASVFGDKLPTRGPKHNTVNRPATPNQQKLLAKSTEGMTLPQLKAHFKKVYALDSNNVNYTNAEVGKVVSNLANEIATREGADTKSVPTEAKTTEAKTTKAKLKSNGSPFSSGKSLSESDIADLKARRTSKKKTDSQTNTDPKSDPEFEEGLAKVKRDAKKYAKESKKLTKKKKKDKADSKSQGKKSKTKSKESSSFTLGKKQLDETNKQDPSYESSEQGANASLDISHQVRTVADEAKVITDNFLEGAEVEKTYLAENTSFFKFVTKKISKKAQAVNKRITDHYREKNEAFRKSLIDLNVQNSTQLFELLKAAAPAHDRRVEHLLQSMQAYAEKYNIVTTVELKDIKKDKKTGKLYSVVRDGKQKAVKGSFIPNKHGGKIILYTNSKGYKSDKTFHGAVYTTAIHELLHALTIHNINNNPKLDAEITRLRELALKEFERYNKKANEKGYAPLRKIYGLTDNKEFIAELANPGTLQFLNGIVDPNPTINVVKGTVLASILKVIKASLTKVFGTKDQTVMDSAIALLENELLDGVSTNLDPKMAFLNNILPNDVSTTNQIAKIAKNLDMRRKQGTSIFSKRKNAFNHLDQAIQESEYANAEEVIADVVEFSNEFKEALFDSTDKIGDVSTALSDLRRENPLLEFTTMEKGTGLETLPNNWLDAMAVTAFRYVNEDMMSSVYKDKDAIRSMYGLSNNLPQEVVDNLSTKGDIAALVAQRMGQKVLRDLNIKEAKDAEDGAYIKQLEVSIGSAILQGLEAQGFVTLDTAIQNAALSPWSTTKVKGNNKSYITMVRANTETDFKMDEVTEGNIEYYRENDYRNVLDEIVNPSSTSNRLPSEKPLDENKIPTRIKNSYMKVSKKMRKAMATHSKAKWVTADNRYQAWSKIPESVVEKLLGKRNVEDHLLYFKKTIEGKNLSIDRSVANLKLAMKAMAGKTFHQNPVMQSHQRMGYSQNVLNGQQDKLHRQFSYAEDWVAEIEMGQESFDSFNKAIKHSTGKELSEFVDKDGNYLLPAWEDASKLFEGMDSVPNDSESIVKVLDDIGEELHGFTIFDSINTYKKALANGDSKFTVTGYVEPDGTTNGTVTTAIQTVIDETNPNFKGVVNAGGMFTSDDQYDNFKDYIANNPDNYQILIKKLAKNLKKTKKEASKEATKMMDAFDFLDNVILAPLVDSEGNVTKDGRNFGKPFVMTFVYAKGEESMKQDAINIITDGIYEYIDSNQDNREALELLDQALQNLAEVTPESIGLDSVVEAFDDGELKEFMFDHGELQDTLKQSTDLMRGQPLTEALQENYEDLIKVRGAMTSSLVESYQIAEIVLNHKVLEAEKVKNENITDSKGNPVTPESSRWVRLSTSEYQAVIDEMIKKGEMPTVKHASSEGYADSMMVKNSQEADSSIRSSLRFSKPKKIKVVTNLVQDKVETQKSNHLRLNARIEKFNSNVRLRAFVTSILGFDGNVQGKMMQAQNSIGAVLNIHDAIMIGYNNWIEGGKKAGEIYAKQHASYDLLTEVTDTAVRMQAVKKKYSKVSPELRKQLLTVAKRRNELLQRKKLLHKKPMIALAEYNVMHGHAKKRWISKLVTSDQFDVGERNDITHLGLSEKADIRERALDNLTEIEEIYDSAEDTDFGPVFDEFEDAFFLDTSVSSATIVDEFNTLGKVDASRGIQVSDAQQNYLKSFIANIGAPLFSKTDNIRLKVTSTTVMGIDTNVISSKKKVGITYGSDGSIQESFARGLVQSLFKQLDKDNSLKRQIIEIYEEVVNDPKITWESLVAVGSKLTQKDINEAKKLYEKAFNGSMSDFASYALTNEAVRKAIKGVGIPSVYKIKGKNLTPFQKMNNWVSEGVTKLFSNPSASQSLEQLFLDIRQDRKSMAMAASTHDVLSKVEHTSGKYIDSGNKVVATLLGKGITKATEKWGTRNPILYAKNNSTLARAARLPYTLAASTGNLLALSVRVHAHPELADMLIEGMYEFGNNIGNFVSNMKVELMGTTEKNKKLHKILRLTKHYVDAAHTNIASSTRKQLIERFHEEPTKEELAHLTTAVLKTDLRSIFESHPNDPAYVQKLLDSDRERFDRRLELKTDIENMVGESGIYLRYAEELAHFMTTGISRTADLPTNALVIAQKRTRKMIRKKEYMKKKEIAKLEKMLDEYITIEALSNTSKESLKVTADLFKSEEKNNSENNGIRFMAEMHSIAQDMNLTKVHGNDRSKEIKGYVHNPTSGASVKFVSSKFLKYYTNKGYRVVEKSRNSEGKALYIMVNTENSQERYVTGIVNLESDSLLSEVSENDTAYVSDRMRKKGHVVIYKDRMMPVPINGSSRQGYAVPYKVAEKYLTVEDDAASIVGNTMGFVTAKSKATVYNAQTVDALKEDYDKHYVKDGIDGKYRSRYISFNSDTHPDIWNVLPSKFRDDLVEAFGTEEDIMIDREFINLVFGFRKLSISGLFGNDPTLTKKVVFHAEKIWQGIVTRAKTNVVILTPGVLIGNVTSNLVISAVAGMPPSYILGKQTEAIREMTKYRNMVQERDNLKRELEILAKSSNKDSKYMAMSRKKSNLDSAIKYSKVHPLVEAGLYTSYIEEVSGIESSFTRSIDNAYAAFSKEGKQKGFTNLLDKAGSKSNKYATGLYKTAVVAQDTQLAQDLRYATQISDFVARYAMYEYMTTVKGKPKEQVIDDVIETFVSYDWNSSAEMQYINDMGILMYTKFLFRIQKVLLKQFKDRPVSSVASLVGQNALGNISDISDSFLFSAFRLSRLSDPTKLVDDAFQFNLLNYLEMFL